MKHTNCREEVVEVLQTAGITLNGNKPYDLRVQNSAFYERVLAEGEMGFGESYMDEWWECDALDKLINIILRSNLADYVKQNWSMIWHSLRSRIFNLQKLSRAFQVGESHYDIGNDLFKAMLDDNMVYTCGYWKDTDSLADAQVAKMDLICRKIGLVSGMRVLDIGCGFGGFAKYAAEKFGVHVTGITISKEQAKLACERCSGLSVDIQLHDYRQIFGQFDRIISIGTFEHMGYKNYRTYMQKIYDLLTENGMTLLHTIGGNIKSTTTNPWTAKYIFTNGMIPSIAQIGKAMEGLFVMEDWQNFGEDYDKTLMAWHVNFKRAWPELKRKYSNRFYRMWEYYLLSCAGAFRARELQLWQIVMTKKGMSQPTCRIS